MPSILVTGAAKGFGRAVCLELASKGHDLVIHYRASEKEAVETASLCHQRGVKAELCQGDFATHASLEDFIHRYTREFPETKGVVNNVGNYLLKPLLSTSTDEWSALMQTNVHAPFFIIQALIPSLRRLRGVIVNVGTCGLHALRAQPSRAAYMLSKMALWHMTLSFAKELAPDLVRVNMVSPGHLETSVDLQDPTQLPMKRAATLEEAAQLVAFLFEESNNYLTGQNIEIAGGIGL